MNDLGFSLFVIFLIFYLSASNFSFSYDSTDDLKNKERSGIILYTDYGTGLQYIKFGIFEKARPRLDKNGKHINIYDREE